MPSVPAIFLLVVALRRHAEQRSALLRATLVAGLIGSILTALFYAPFVLHPQFRATYTYLVQRRLGIGGAGAAGGDRIPYNNLLDFFTRTTIYNSSYYVLLLIPLAVAALVIAYRRGLGRLWGTVIGVLLVSGLALTMWNPTWLTIGGRDLTALFFVTVLVLAWLMPNMRASERSLWLWFGVPFLLMLFFTAKPRTHVYVFFTPWVLISGMILGRGWLAVRKHLSLPAAAAVGAATAAIVIMIFGAYTYLYFVFTDVEILRTWQENRPPGYWTSYDTLDNRATLWLPSRQWLEGGGSSLRRRRNRRHLRYERV